MSGIAGILYLDGRPATRSTLDAMLGLVRHRGPDAEGQWAEGAVGLAGCLLRTTPEANQEHPPLVGPDGRLVLAADARIDNRDELIRRLRPAVRAPLVTDADLILAAYETWGARAPEYLIGDFAFAVWDETHRRLFCVRDPIGNRPFYYTYLPGRLFAFASEIKAVLCVEGVPAALDEARVADYLGRTADDPEATFFRHVRCLPSAHALTLDDGRPPRLRRYWMLDPDRALSLGSDEAYTEGFLEVFTEAVRARLRSDGPPGVMLSGGLDSSSVACVARKAFLEEGRAPVKTFSAIFPDLPEADLRLADERAYLDALEAQGGLEMYRVPLDEVSPLFEIDHVIRQVDGPPIIGNAYLLQTMHRAARAQGVRVILDGAEGDLAVSYGAGYLGELALEGRWDALHAELSALARRGGASLTGMFEARAAYYVGARAKRHPLTFVSSDLPRLSSLFNLSRRRLLRRFVLDRWFGPGGVPPSGEATPPTLASPDLLRRIGSREPAPSPDLRDKPFSERLRHWADLYDAAPGIAALQEETAHIAALDGIERRHPFYDVRVLAYCVALPGDQKLRDGWPRYILRTAMQGLLPEPIQWRSDKADLSPNFVRNLIRKEQKAIETLYGAELDRLAPYVDLEKLHRAREQGDAVSMWSALVLARWLRYTEGSAWRSSNAVSAHPSSE